MSESFKEVNELADRIYDLRVQIKELESRSTELNKEKTSLEQKFIATLEAAGLEGYKGKAGSYSVTTRMSVNVPNAPEDKAAFFTWLTEQGLFETYATVHSQSLNSLYRIEIEKAAESGVDDFKIPGLGEPKFNKTLSFRAAK